MKFSILLAYIVAATTTAAIPLELAKEIFERELEVHNKRAATSLHDGFKAKGKEFFGTCADPGTFSNAQCAAVIKQHFGQVTPENSMKWDATEPNRNQFNYGNADRLVQFAQDNNKLIRGHTLLWHSQLPNWVKNIGDRNTLTQVIENHVANVAGRYKGKIYHWDVVNEILSEQGGLRDSVFQRVLGESFVKIAFDAAKKADPTAKLYINDYNLDSAPSKRSGMVNLVKRALSQGVPIDGIGTQCHLNAGQIQGMENHLRELVSAGVKEVAITELDISGASANDYTTVVRACLNVPQCVGITVWGVSDNQSWRSGNSPLLFNNSFQPKPAATAILNML